MRCAKCGKAAMFYEHQHNGWLCYPAGCGAWVFPEDAAKVNRHKNPLGALGNRKAPQPMRVFVETHYNDIAGMRERNTPWNVIVQFLNHREGVDYTKDQYQKAYGNATRVKRQKGEL